MPIKYVPFFPEPVSGQAILSNFNRVLKYNGVNDLTNTLSRGAPLYEMEIIEEKGSKNNKNMIIQGECVSACAYLKEQGIKVDLVYIDPPFASDADYSKNIYIRKNPKSKINELENKELDIEQNRRFEEKMYGDIWNKENYLNWMYENLIAIKSIMSDNASIYVHLDWHIGHYVKVMMDEIFGEDGFVNEIVWAYRSGGASKKTSIARKHDTIYFYTNNPLNFEVNTIKERQYLEKSFMGSLQDENGRYYVDTILTDTLSGVINRVMDDGTIKEYSCRPVLNLSQERLDYATQKPEGLLELLIEIASKKGQIVADFFGGSGVTAAMASKLDRNFIHCDVGINSIQTVRDRLIKSKTDFTIYRIKDGVSLFRNPIQTMDKITKMLKIKKDTTLGEFWSGSITDLRYGLVPVHIPDLKDSTSRTLLDEEVANKIAYKEITELDNSIKKVIIYYIDINNREKIESILKNKDLEIEIEIRDLKEVIDEISVDDELDFEIKSGSKLGEYLILLDDFYSDSVKRKITEYNIKSAQNDKKGTFKPITISENGLELIEMISLDCSNSEGVWHSDHEVKLDNESHMIIDGVKTKELWNGKISCDKKPLRIKVRNICGDETIYKIE